MLGLLLLRIGDPDVWLGDDGVMERSRYQTGPSKRCPVFAALWIEHSYLWNHVIVWGCHPPKHDLWCSSNFLCFSQGFSHFVSLWSCLLILMTASSAAPPMSVDIPWVHTTVSPQCVCMCSLSFFCWKRLSHIYSLYCRYTSFPVSFLKTCYFPVLHSTASQKSFLAVSPCEMRGCAYCCCLRSPVWSQTH